MRRYVQTNTSAVLETITPVLASQYLDRIPGSQRRLREKHVKDLARSMSCGEFRVNGDSIRFDRSGRLIDGQHRLSACVLSGQPFQSVVVRGLAPESYVTMDTGKKRTAADFLRYDGIEWSQAKATIMGGYYSLVQAASPTTSDVYESAKQADSLLSSLVPIYASLGRKRWQVTPRMVCVGILHLIRCRVPVIEAVAFANDLVNGTGLPAGDPVTLLRDVLLTGHTTARKSLPVASRKRLHNVVALIVQTWNLRTKGRYHLTRLRPPYMSDGIRYQMPKVVTR